MSEAEGARYLQVARSVTGTFLELHTNAFVTELHLLLLLVQLQVATVRLDLFGRF